jgi:hypothetical protein
MAGKKERQQSKDMLKNLKPKTKSKNEKTDQQKIDDRARWLKMKQEPGQSGAGSHRTDKDYRRNPKHKNKGGDE